MFQFLKKEVDFSDKMEKMFEEVCLLRKKERSKSEKINVLSKQGLKQGFKQHENKRKTSTLYYDTMP